MEYIELTREQRLAMVKERLLGYEALHFSQEFERVLALETGNVEVATSSLVAIQDFEHLISVCKDAIKKLESESEKE